MLIFESVINQTQTDMKTLTGSEKQIAYAASILKKFNDTIKFGYTKLSKPEHIEFLKNYENQINMIEDSGIIISKTKNVPLEGSIVTNPVELKMMMQNIFNK